MTPKHWLKLHPIANSLVSQDENEMINWSETLFMYQWLVFAHILGVFGFLLAHGTTAAVTFALEDYQSFVPGHICGKAACRSAR